MVKSYLIDGKSISSNPRYRGTALEAISGFGESWSSYCTWSLELLCHQRTKVYTVLKMLQFLHEDALSVSFLCLLIRCIFAIWTTLGRVDIWRTEAETDVFPVVHRCYRWNNLWPQRWSIYSVKCFFIIDETTVQSLTLSEIQIS